MGGGWQGEARVTAVMEGSLAAGGSDGTLGARERMAKLDVKPSPGREPPYPQGAWSRSWESAYEHC